MRFASDAERSLHLRRLSELSHEMSVASCGRR
jgi:hypothetical protein